MAVQDILHQTFQPELLGDDWGSNKDKISVFKSLLQLTSENTTAPPIKIVHYVINLRFSFAQYWLEKQMNL